MKSTTSGAEGLITGALGGSRYDDDWLGVSFFGFLCFEVFFSAVGNMFLALVFLDANMSSISFNFFFGSIPVILLKKNDQESLKSWSYSI